MVERVTYLKQLETALGRSPITALLGPRQCGKTTLARQLAATRDATIFDLDSARDVRRLANPELVLGNLDGLVVLDEIQHLPQLFSALRVLVDRPDARARFLILGSASPELVRGVSESLAGREEFVELTVERGRRIGFEVRFSEAPRVTKAMRTAMETLALDHLFIVCPTREACRVDDRITMLPDTDMVDLRARIAAL